MKSDDTIVKDFIQKNGCELKKTEVLTVDGNGRAYLKQKNQSYKILNFALSKGVKW